MIVPYPGTAEVAWWLIALFALTLGAKLYTIRELPAPVPTVDQWFAEPGTLYIPFAEGHLTWRAMFALHNEHRIFFTRLIDLFLLMVNGQWDPLLQTLVNAVFHSATGVLLAATLWLAVGRRRIDVVVVGCGLVLLPPFAWENTILGFQSQFYFLLLFSILALWLIWRSPPRTRSWAIGWVCALCSLFTAAGGLVTVAVATAFEIWRSWQDRERWRTCRYQHECSCSRAGDRYRNDVPTAARACAATAGDVRRFRGRAFPEPGVAVDRIAVTPTDPVAASRDNFRPLSPSPG